MLGAGVAEEVAVPGFRRAVPDAHDEPPEKHGERLSDLNCQNTIKW